MIRLLCDLGGWGLRTCEAGRDLVGISPEDLSTRRDLPSGKFEHWPVEADALNWGGRRLRACSAQLGFGANLSAGIRVGEFKGLHPFKSQNPALQRDLVYDRE